MRSEWRILAWFALLGAMAGGIRAYLRRNPGTSWKDLLAKMLGAGLTGYIVGLVCLEWLGPDSIRYVTAIVGLSGWLGTAVLDYAADIALRLLQRRADRLAQENGYGITEKTAGAGRDGGPDGGPGPGGPDGGGRL